MIRPLLEVADVPEAEDSHSDGYEDRIKDVEEIFVRDQISTIALQILDHTEDAADQDHAAGCVQNDEVSLLWSAFC